MNLIYNKIKQLFKFEMDTAVAGEQPVIKREGMDILKFFILKHLIQHGPNYLAMIIYCYSYHYAAKVFGDLIVLIFVPFAMSVLLLFLSLTKLRFHHVYGFSLFVVFSLFAHIVVMLKHKAVYFTATPYKYLFVNNSNDLIFYFDNFFTAFTLNYPSLTTFNLVFGLDELSLLFFFLTELLILFTVVLTSGFVKTYKTEFLAILFLINCLLFQFFSALNLLHFYVSFEAILIPMFLMIGYWGARERKNFAAYLFFFYTLIGSLLMLIGIVYLVTVFLDINYATLVKMHLILDYDVQVLLFLSFLIAFLVKLPALPFHLWLPEAHVEAPTLGSVLLAGILLKLGGYGILRFLLPLFPQVSVDLASLVHVIAIVSVVYSALIGLTQVDLKKIVAYSSITHMNFSLVGLFSADPIAIQGSVYSMFSHGLVAAGLFFAVGTIYDRYGTRLLGNYGGLISTMPILSVFAFFLVAANVGIPPLSGFVSEILVLMGLVSFTNKIVILILFTSSIVLTINFFWVYNRIFTGPVNEQFNKSLDLNILEIMAFLFLVIFILLIGIWPYAILGYTDTMIDSVLAILNNYK